jgi:diaminopimelate epimerase
MHAQGNDYIYFDLLNEQELRKDWKKIAVTLSNRHFGIGGDGIVLILPSENADATMKMFNADGSEAEMCGSALRCIGSYLAEKCNKNELIVSTKSGNKKVLTDNSLKPSMISVEMGIPCFEENKKCKLSSAEGYQINAGNPHFVCFMEELIPAKLNLLGSQIEHDKEFPNRTNVDFVKINSRDDIEIYFWERGSGNTLACGTGAIASFFTAFQMNLVNSSIMVTMPGGKVVTRFFQGNYWLEGIVENVFRGEIEL